MFDRSRRGFHPFPCVYMFPSVSTFGSFGCSRSISMLVLIFAHVRSATVRWFVEVDSVVEYNAFMLSLIHI